MIKVTVNLMETLYFLGIDISKKSFQAALTVDGANFHTVEVQNNASAIKSFMNGLKKQAGLSFTQLRVCMEHTGIYGYPLLDYLVKANISVCVEPALQIKQSQGMTRGKSDQIDAKRIALYAYKNQGELRFWRPQRQIVQKLKALLVLRDRLVKIKTQLAVPLKEMSCYVESTICLEVSKGCNKTLKALGQDIDKVERQIDELILTDQRIKTQLTYASSVPGVGKITALNMIIETGEFEQITQAKKFACYAGVAPFEHTSGSSIRGRTRVSKMANMTVKKLLHLAAMSSIQCCDEIKVYYHRKVEGGKNKMSVINAVRNKLISRVFSCVQQQRKYEKIHRHALA
jgi:transposase